MQAEIDARVDQEVQQRLQGDLSEWEEAYKSRYLIQLRESVAEELRSEFEAQIMCLLE
jgi:hypothetical protein